MRAITAAALAAAMFALAGCSVLPLKPFAYPAWGFAVSFRAPPTETPIPAHAAGGPRRGFRTELANMGRDLFVSVADGSGSTKGDDQVLAEFPQCLARGGTLKSQTYVAVGALVGREVLIDRPGQETLRERIFISHRRLYEVGAQSSLGPTDREVQDFLDSFHLISG
jgi:hypothetical protein